MDRGDAIDHIFCELRQAEKKFPSWPEDIVHGAGILVEEAGETMKAALDYFYGRSKDKFELIKEASQTGAMAIRLLVSLLPDADEEGEMKKYYTWKESLHEESFYNDEDRANDEMGITYLASEVDAERAKDKEELRKNKVTISTQSVFLDMKDKEIARLRKALELLRKRFVRKPYGSYWVCEYCNHTGWDYPRHERNCVLNSP